MKYDILGLQAFLGIAEHGNFQRAAASLNLSPTALSHRLRKFEAELGVQLVARTTRSVMLTAPGREFVPRARRILGDIATSLEELRDVGRERQQIVSLGCLPTLAAHVLPDILRDFATQHPNTAVRLVDQAAPEIADLVLAGSVEFGLTVGSALGPELEFQPIAKSPLSLICPKGHALAKKSSVEATDLEGLSLIRLGPRDGARLQIEAALGARTKALRWDYEVHQALSAVRLVAAGLGLTIAPQFAVDQVRDRDVVIVPLGRPRIVTTLGILSRKSVPLSPLAQALIRIMRRRLRAKP
jgi:DNA-binding transcriptional LysR family regulator